MHCVWEYMTTGGFVHIPAQRAGRGHTLLELVVVITITGLIAGIVAPPLVEATRARNRAVYRAALLAESRTALERMTRELREMPLATGTRAPDLSHADTDRIEFGATGFRLEDDVLQKLGTDGSWRTLAQHVSSFTLSYYDEDGAALGTLPLAESSRTDVYRIGVTLTLARASETITLRSGVFPRCWAYRNM